MQLLGFPGTGCWTTSLSVLPIVSEDVLIMSVALSRLLRQLPDALLLFLAGFVRPHQPNLQNRKQPSETQETDNSTNIPKTDGAMASTSVEHDSAPKS